MARRPRPLSRPKQDARESRRRADRNGDPLPEPWRNRPGRSWLILAGAIAILSSLSVTAWFVLEGQRARWASARAEAATQAGDWSAALAAWKLVNAGDRASGATHFQEARAAAALGRPREAEAALKRATAADPANPMPWRLWLEILRVEDRPTDALRIGQRGLEAISPGDRPNVLRALTLALLADLPDDLARDTLSRWASEADGRVPDPDALAALYQRMNTMPRAGDSRRSSRIDRLARLLAQDPGLLPAREAMVTALADAGETAEGRRVLDAWPAGGRDARYWRLKGRWALEYDQAPGEAAESFTRALGELPHDWKTRVRLARAYRSLGRDPEARREAEAVGRLRERLDPKTLGPLLARALDSATPQSLAQLADLCAGVGLKPLADAWKREAATLEAH